MYLCAVVARVVCTVVYFFCTCTRPPSLSLSYKLPALFCFVSFPLLVSSASHPQDAKSPEAHHSYQKKRNYVIAKEYIHIRGVHSPSSLACILFLWVDREHSRALHDLGVSRMCLYGKGRMLRMNRVLSQKT